MMEHKHEQHFLSFDDERNLHFHFKYVARLRVHLQEGREGIGFDKVLTTH